MKSIRLPFRLVCLLLIATLPSIAQQYPVQVITQLLPPYTLNVPQWYTGTSEKLAVLLTNQDLQRPTTSVRLRLMIQGPSVRLTSREGVYYPTIHLDAGVPTRIALGDLAPYFNPDHLNFEGINRSSYLNSYTLPEGFYQICFEAVEVRSNQVVGRGICAQAWLSLNDPPFLNLPVKGESIIQRDPTNIIFQWTPRHMADPNLAFNTEYEFTMAELWDNGMVPEAAFTMGMPFYRTTTRTSTLLYGPLESPLLPGKRYAWRIRVQSADGSTNSSFKNQGYSEVYWFRYQNDCSPPLHVQAQVSSSSGARITWTPVFATTNGAGLGGTYQVDYRERGQSAETWYSVPSSSNRVTLYPLKPDKTYEYRVARSCDDNLSYVYSDIKRFTTHVEEPKGDCAASNEAPKPITNREPIQTLFAGDVITSGGGNFITRIVQVSGQGKFTGYGYARIGLLGKAQFKVKFTNIAVNTDKQLIGGTIESTSDETEQQIADVDTIARDIKQMANKLADFITKLKSPKSNQAVLKKEAETLDTDMEKLMKSIPDSVMSTEKKEKMRTLLAQTKKYTLLAMNGDAEGSSLANQYAGQAAEMLTKLENQVREKAANTNASTAYLGTELYISPSGYPIKIPDAAIKQFVYDAYKINKSYPNGVLYGYKNAEDVLFLAKIEDGKFLGYENQQTKELYQDTTVYPENSKVKIFILEESTDGCKYKQYTTSYTVPAKTQTILTSLNFEGLTKDNLKIRDRCSTNPEAKEQVNRGSKNMLVFVNGYRFGIPNEHPDSDHALAKADRHQYWEGFDKQFVNQLRSGTVLYADGHHGIKTSNHQDIIRFYNSAKSAISPLSTNPKEIAIKYGSSASMLIPFAGKVLPYIIEAKTADPTYSGGKLNSEPNETGFNQRRENGKKAGETLLADIQNQKIRTRKDAKDNLIDTLDIVAHSMGYAYALGMTDALKNKIPLGRFYIIAPENACSGDINLDDFEEVWQYGANLGEPNADPLEKQDGVAPQCAVRGIRDLEQKKKGGRVFIPDDEPKGFLQSHSIGNYKWIFTKIPKGGKGYVKTRD